MKREALKTATPSAMNTTNDVTPKTLLEAGNYVDRDPHRDEYYHGRAFLLVTSI